jgi:MFS family permease
MLPSLPASPTALPERWVTRHVVLILVVQVVFGFGWSLYLLTPTFLTTVLHAGPETIGRISAAGGLAGLLTVPFAARGLDRLGRKFFFRIGAALIVLLSIGFTLVREIGPFVYVLQGCVAAAFVLAFNATAALLADHTPPAKLGQAIGWLGGANVLMNAVSTMLAEPLAKHYGWDSVFQLGAIAGIAAFLLSFALRDAPAARLEAARQTSMPGTGAGTSLSTVLVSTMLISGVFIAMFGFIQPYALGLGAREVRGFFLGFSTSAVVCRLLLGGLGDRLGRRKLSALILIGYALVTLVTVRLQPQFLVLYGLGFGAAHGLLYPTMNALVLEVVPASRRGLGMVLYNGAFNAGTTLGALAWGLLAAQHGYPSVYAVATLVALVSAAILMFGRRATA